MVKVLKILNCSLFLQGKFHFFCQTAMGISGPVGILWISLGDDRAEVSWVSAPTKPACHQSNFTSGCCPLRFQPIPGWPLKSISPLTWGNCQNSFSYSQSPLKDAPAGKRNPKYWACFSGFSLWWWLHNSSLLS